MRVERWSRRGKSESARGSRRRVGLAWKLCSVPLDTLSFLLVVAT